jgi:hypothetical protein
VIKLNNIKMKAIQTMMIFVAVFGLSSCIVDEVGPQGPEGPQGPQGPEGPQGPAGDSGYVFEYEQVNFTAPDYEVFLEYPNNFESFASDVTLVYFLWDVTEVNGVETEIWRQLPQTLLLNEGTLQYNFDYAVTDIRLFMEADFDMSVLGAIYTDNWVVRVVIVPGEFWNSGRISGQEISYQEISEALSLPALPTPANTVSRRTQH